MKQKKCKKNYLVKAICAGVLLTMVAAPSMEANAKAKLSKKALTMNVGDTAKLKVTGNAKKSKVKWSTSDKKIATVSKKGKVTAKKAGKATITAKVKKKKIKCKVQVKNIDATQNNKNDNGNTGKSLIRTVRFFNNNIAAAYYAESMVGMDYDQVPGEMQIGGHWCAAFTNFIYDNHIAAHNSISKFRGFVESNPNEYKTGDIQSWDKNGNYKPEIGDLVLYQEDADEFYDHIGIVVAVRLGDNGKWQIETVEGNFFEPTCNGEVHANNDYSHCEKRELDHDITKYEYCEDGAMHPYEKRHVGRVGFDDVRYHMIEKYIRPISKRRTYLVGDVDGNNKINVVDLLYILQAYNCNRARESFDFRGEGNDIGPAVLYYRCDINEDGVIDTRDASELKNYLLGK